MSGGVVHFEIHAADRDRAGRSYRRAQQVVDRQELENIGSSTYLKDSEGNLFGAIQAAAPAD